MNSIKKFILPVSLFFNTIAFIILLTDPPFYINDNKEFRIIQALIIIIYFILIIEYLYKRSIISSLIFLSTFLNLLVADIVVSNSEVVLRKKILRN